MKQLVLDLDADAPPSLDNFVTGANGELLARLRGLASDEAEQREHATPLPQLYLWGSAGSGRSHLLQASVAAAQATGRPARLVAAREVGSELPLLDDGLLAIDDVDALDPPAQIALFNAFNRSRSCGQRLLLAGSQPPLALALREDLRTRIGQCLVYQLQPLDDETRAAIIATLAQRRGLPLASEVLDYLMCHGERELPRLLAVFEALDAAALERKRPITLPLLRELIQRGLQL